MTGEELRSQFGATVRLYRDAAQDTLRGLRKTWFYSFAAIPLGFAGYFGAIVAVALGSFIGGFFLGLLTAYLMSAYLVFVRAGVERERLFLHEIVPRTNELFSSLLNILFVLFILFLGISFFGMGLRADESSWIIVLVKLMILVALNPIPEICYLGQRGAGSAFGESLEFMKENGIEWLLPLVLGLVPVILANPLGLTILFGADGPIRGLFHLFSLFYAVAAVSGVPSMIGTIIALFGFYATLVFRGCLFKKLSGSTRRKRRYQYKFV